MVCHGKKEAGGRAAAFWWLSLVGFAALLCLLASPEGFGVHLRLRLHLDSLHPESDHPPAAQEGARELSGLREKLSAAFQFLPELRRAAGGGYFLGAELVAADSVSGIPYFFRIGWKSGCAWP